MTQYTKELQRSVDPNAGALFVLVSFPTCYLRLEKRTSSSLQCYAIFTKRALFGQIKGILPKKQKIFADFW